MILFTADIHLKLGQKNVPYKWAWDRYIEFFSQARNAETNCNLHIVGGDLFDRLPSMDELELYFEFIRTRSIETWIIDGNHEASKKGKTFLSKLKSATRLVNPLVTIIDHTLTDTKYKMNLVPYNRIHDKDVFDSLPPYPTFTHVRGEIPPHVKPEIDLSLLDKFPIVFAGDLHSHSNTQRNIIYPGSPMTVGFHRNPVETGYLLIDEDDDFSWEWHPFDLPQLIRNTVSDPKDMIPTDFHHTIYELEGDLKELSSVQNSELLDKRLIRKNVTSKLTLTKSTTLLEELVQYFDRVLELPPETIEKVLKAFNDHSRNIGME